MLVHLQPQTESQWSIAWATIELLLLLGLGNQSKSGRNYPCNSCQLPSSQLALSAVLKFSTEIPTNSHILRLSTQTMRKKAQALVESFLTADFIFHDWTKQCHCLPDQTMQVQDCKGHCQKCTVRRAKFVPCIYPTSSNCNCNLFFPHSYLLVD